MANPHNLRATRSLPGVCWRFFSSVFAATQSQPVRLDVKPMDPAKPIDCKVSIDLDAKQAKFTVGDASVEAELKDMKSVDWYGYIAENTTTDFSKIKVVNAE